MEEGMSVTLCKPHNSLPQGSITYYCIPTFPNLFFCVSKPPLITSLPAYNTQKTAELSPEAWKTS